MTEFVKDAMLFVLAIFLIVFGYPILAIGMSEQDPKNAFAARLLIVPWAAAWLVFLGGSYIL